jgi:hypothetical protein
MIYDPFSENVFVSSDCGIMVTSDCKSSSYGDPNLNPSIAGLYFDGYLTRTVTSSLSDVLTVDDTSTSQVGNLLFDRVTGGITTIVRVIDPTHLQVSPAVNWGGGQTVFLCYLITSKSQYSPMHAGAPGYIKQWKRLAWMLKASGSVTLGVSSDVNATETTATAFTPNLSTLYPVPLGTPIEHSRSHWLLPSVAMSDYNKTFELHGFSAEFDATAARTRQ